MWENGCRGTGMCDLEVLRTWDDGGLEVRRIWEGGKLGCDGL